MRRGKSRPVAPHTGGAGALTARVLWNPEVLESEGERIQREMVRYIKFAQLASASVKIIFETVSGWRQEGHPMRKFVSPARDSTGGSHMASSFDSPSDA